MEEGELQQINGYPALRELQFVNDADNNVTANVTADQLAAYLASHVAVTGSVAGDWPTQEEMHAAMTKAGHDFEKNGALLLYDAAADPKKYFVVFHIAGFMQFYGTYLTVA